MTIAEIQYKGASQRMPNSSNKFDNQKINTQMRKTLIINQKLLPSGLIPKVEVSHKDEKWKVTLQTTGNSPAADLELTHITFDLHNGSTWSGNIQDLAAIQAYAMNAADFIGKYIARDIAESEIGTTCLTELEQLLSHFSKTA